MKLIPLLIVTFVYIIDLLLLVPKYTKCKYDHTPRKRKLVWKGTCIGCPLAILLIMTVVRLINGTADSTLCFLTAGMLLCAFGDIILEIRFMKGGFFFLLGHLTYVTTLLKTEGSLSHVSLILYVALVTVGTVLTCKKLGSKYRYALIAYNMVISGSFSLSVPLIMTGNPGFVLMGTGLCFLALSDWLLARNKVFGSNYSWSLISLLFYFGGQILISTYPFF